MNLEEREIVVPTAENHEGMLDRLASSALQQLPESETPIRLAVTRTTPETYHCELGVATGESPTLFPQRNRIFEFRKRAYENTSQFNAALVIPTGIGAELGGHSGDGGALARLIAGACDKLITHPNVVNAADINELPENGLYVEGSVLSQLLMGTIGLQEVRSNRVLLVLDEHPDRYIQDLTVNAVSAARAALGLDCPAVVTMNERLILRALYANSGRAVGRIEYFERLCAVLEEYAGQFDALALATLIHVPNSSHADYFRRDKAEMVNPWGGVEAMLTHAVSLAYDLPSAHSPMTPTREVLDLDVGVVDPRKSAEAVSTTYLHCILKGLAKSPRIIRNPPDFSAPGVLTAADVSCLIIPDGCIGLPTLAALEQGIPVIAVRENRNCMNNRLEELPFAPGILFVVENYLEAVGVMTAIKSGVALGSVRRPISETFLQQACQDVSTSKHSLSARDTAQSLELTAGQGTAPRRIL